MKMENEITLEFIEQSLWMAMIPESYRREEAQKNKVICEKFRNASIVVYERITKGPQKEI